MERPAIDDYTVRGPFVRFDRATHIVNPSAGGEHTLCGVAMDAGSSEDAPELRWRATESTVVTCERPMVAGRNFFHVSSLRALHTNR